MLSQQDLCLLQDVKSWLYGNSIDDKWNTNADDMLGSYISAASHRVLTELNRPMLVAHNVSEVRRSYGGDTIMLREYPLLGDMTSVTIEGVPLSKQTSSMGVGWYCTNPWDGYGPGMPAVIANLGGSRSLRPVIELKYVAGYAVLSEAQSVPLVPPYTIQPLEPFGRFAADISVISATGLTPFTTAESLGTVVAGKYLPPQPPSGPVKDANWVPLYNFAPADAGALVYISYSYTPQDLSFAVTKLVGELWRYKERIGEKSKMLPSQGGTAAFDLSAMPADVAAIINIYKRVVAIN